MVLTLILPENNDSNSKVDRFPSFWVVNRNEREKEVQEGFTHAHKCTHSTHINKLFSILSFSQFQFYFPSTVFAFTLFSPPFSLSLQSCLKKDFKVSSSRFPFQPHNHNHNEQHTNGTTRKDIQTGRLRGRRPTTLCSRARVRLDNSSRPGAVPTILSKPRYLLHCPTATTAATTATTATFRLADHTTTTYSLLPSHVLRTWTDAIENDDDGGDCCAITIAVSTVSDAFYSW